MLLQLVVVRDVGVTVGCRMLPIVVEVDLEA